MPPNPDEVHMGSQSIEFLEPNPRLVGLAESILQQNAAILDINRALVASLLNQIVVMKTEIPYQEPE